MAQSKFRGGPTGGQLPLIPLKKAATWIIIGMIGLGFLIGLAVYTTYRHSQGKPLIELPRVVRAQQLQLGDVFTDITTEWSKPIRNDWETVVSGCQPLVKNVYWQVKFDMDENRVYTQSPINAPGDHTLDYTNSWNTLEYRIAPDQEVTHGKFTYHRGPRQ